jgi:acyl-CoA synthetase (AMP-forming)/AMP-acid ligase II
VAGLPDPLFGTRIAAWLVLAPGARTTHADLERFARAQLARYKVPRAWHSVAALPRNAAGKLVRRELPLLAE